MCKSIIHYLNLIFFIFLINNATEPLFSQGCYNCTIQNPASIISIPVNSGYETISNCMKGGDYAICKVTEGYIYKWTTCNVSYPPNFNSQLTLFHGQGCSLTNYLASNDNACNSGSIIIWKATFTGLVTILLNRKNCKVTTAPQCVNLSWESVFSDCDHPLQLCKGTSDYPATTGQISTYDPFPNTNWGCGGSNYISNQTWYYVKIAEAGDIKLDITSSSSSADIDGLVWGPLDTIDQTCQSMLDVPVSCDFNNAQSFSLDFYAPSIGKYYMIMISNPSNTLTNITLSFLNTSNGKIELCPAVLSYNQPLCINGDLQLTAFTNEAIADFQWTGPGNFTSTSQNPVIYNVTSINSGIYTCTYTTAYGISTTNTISISFLPKPITSNIYHH